MNNENIILPLAKRGNGDIYLGVVGAVRTGKSTFIKKFIQELIVPNIDDEIEKKRYLDEIPQSAEGKTIMTTEPKFVPSTGAKIKINEFSANIKLIDCVGYIIKDANGYLDENNNPRMVTTPWFSEAIPFTKAAEIGTKKVIKDHSTIGIVVTSDGSFNSISRDNYIEAEDKTINELKEIGKPFIVILNTSKPKDEHTINLANELRDKHNVPVLPISIIDMSTNDIYEILKTALYEYNVVDINYSIPEWVHILDNNNDVKKHYLELIKNSSLNIKKIKDVDNILDTFKDSKYINKSYISNVDTSTGIVTINLDSSDDLYNEVVNDLLGESINSKASMMRVFQTYKTSKEEFDNIKQALKQAKSTGYGIIYPTLKDMKLQPPELVKQGSRYGVKLKAGASSIHLVKVDVESTFEPIIGSELQSKELINYLTKDVKSDPSSIWKSEIFGRSLNEMVEEGMKAKLSIMNDNTKYKLGQTLTKIVNKGSSNLIAIVL